MSDDELLDELERERGFAARLGYLIFAQPMEKAAARIREQREVLEECERAVAELLKSDWLCKASWERGHALLAKLRAQEKTDD